MNDFFLSIVNFSITATYIAAAVMLLRLIFKKAPKWISGVLWGLVGLRLLFPFSIESIFSLIPNNKPIPDNITTMPKPEIDSGIPIINDTFNPIISDTFAPSPEVSINPMETVITVASYVWLIGIAAMLIYMAVSYLRVRLKVMESIRTEGNVYKCDNLKTAFILGVIRPKIYVPSDMNKADLEFVAAHERAHIKRLDHVWKPLGFLLLAVYWFNPVLWVAYVLLCRDIELACDEKVLKEMGIESKTRYSTALVNCSVRNKAITACPLAFGEVGIKERVMRILNYKKPAFWVIVLSLVAVAVVAVCFLTDPIREEQGVEGTPTPSVTPNDPIRYPEVDTIPLDSRLIDELSLFFKYIDAEYYLIDSFTLEDKIEKIAEGQNTYSVTFNPNEYYYACAYFDDNRLGNIDFTNSWSSAAFYVDKFTWVGFKNPNDISQYYNGEKFALSVQLNKSMSCENIISGNKTECRMEHFLKFDPVFENNFNTVAPINFDKAFVYSTSSKEDTIVFTSNDIWFYYFRGIPSVVIDNQCYITQFIYEIYQDGTRSDSDLRKQLGKYYDDIIDILITDKYSIEKNNRTEYYGLIKIDDFARIIKNIQKVEERK